MSPTFTVEVDQKERGWCAIAWGVPVGRTEDGQYLRDHFTDQQPCDSMGDALRNLADRIDRYFAAQNCHLNK